MKTVSSQLATHLKLDSATLARLWKIVRKDSVTLAFTDHDQDLTFESVLYVAMGGFTATAVQHKADNSPDNMEVTGFLDSDAISETDLRAKLYDFCDVELRVVNWADLTMGCLKLIKGSLGNVTMVNGQFNAEIRGLNQQLTTLIGDTYGPVCRVDLFSTQCGLNRSDY